MEWYRVFYWTAKLGGLTSAANKLHITQPAVSHTLKQLEEAIGGKLFFRTPKGVTLTSEGEVLYSFVSQALHLISLGEKKIHDMHNLHHGEISVGASDTMCKHYLLPYLKHFSTQFPEIKIRVINRTTPEIITLLKEGEIDFGVVNLPVEDQRIHFHKSAIQQDCLVASPKYAHLAKYPVHVKDLQKYPLILLEQGGITRSYLEEYALAKAYHFSPNLNWGALIYLFNLPKVILD